MSLTSNVTDKSKATKAGFTLIELLTVIAIIGILATILIPVVSAVRESARSSRCVSNMRQIGVAILSYADDHNGSLPTPKHPDRGFDNIQTTFHYQVWEYVGYEGNEFRSGSHTHLTRDAVMANVFHCPGTLLNGFQPVPGGTPSGDPYSYSINAVPNGGGGGANLERRMVIDQFETPSKTMIVAEADTWWIDLSRYQRFGLEPHKEAGNFLFLDAHVETLSFDKVPKSTWDGDGFYFWSGGLGR